MTFFIFTALVWLLALFHLWDHRCFERDLRALEQGMPIERLDWRRVAGGVALKRGFFIRRRDDYLRYAVPVVFFAVLLIGLRGWTLAMLYAAVIIVKWAAVSVTLADDKYTLWLAGRALFSARL